MSKSDSVDKDIGSCTLTVSADFTQLIETLGEEDQELIG